MLSYGRATDVVRELETLDPANWPDVLVSDIALPDEDGIVVRAVVVGDVDFVEAPIERGEEDR